MLKPCPHRIAIHPGRAPVRPRLEGVGAPRSPAGHLLVFAKQCLRHAGTAIERHVDLAGQPQREGLHEKGVKLVAVGDPAGRSGSGPRRSQSPAFALRPPSTRCACSCPSCSSPKHASNRSEERIGTPTRRRARSALCTSVSGLMAKFHRCDLKTSSRVCA